MKYYFAKAYVKPEGKKRYKDITDEEKKDSYLGMVIVQDKADKVQEISTKLVFDVFNSKEKIQGVRGRKEVFGRDIYVDDIDYDTEVTMGTLSTYMWLSTTDSFCLFPEILISERNHNYTGIQKVYKM